MDTVSPTLSQTVNLMGEEFNINYLRSHQGVHAALVSGEVEGVPFRIVDGEIEPGDTYIAERRTGIKLLTCLRNIKEGGYIVPQELAYVYDTYECIKIEFILD